jgi:ubiquinone/menaquinone biosynthesis C-methylase UbiE
VNELKQMLFAINKLFPPVVHPFNLNNDGVKTYAVWQFEKGEETIKNYLAFTDKESMFRDKTVLDIGCGAGGKSLYYASLHAKHVCGVDVAPSYQKEAEALAKQLDLSDRFSFLCADAGELPYADESFDTAIMNDAMEHVDRPEAVLLEIFRVLRKGGRLYINFPPYHHPFGAHLSDAIFIPWVHMLFSEKTLIESYKELVKDLPDGPARIRFRISKKNGKEYFSYINKMTLKRFHRILNSLSLTPVYYREIPLRNVFSIPARLPGFKEMFVKMAVCVLEKP